MNGCGLIYHLPNQCETASGNHQNNGKKIMNQTDIRKIIKECIRELMEAPVSKGGHPVQDYSKVAGGETGQRKQDKGLFDLATKVSKGITSSDIDGWRHQALLSGDKFIVPKSKYQKQQTKTKSVSANIDSLAAIRGKEDQERRATGGRVGYTKVSATYINNQSNAKATYNKAIDDEIKRLGALQSQTKAGDKNYVALQNLIEDLEIRKEEYSLKWEFVTAAFNNDENKMNNVRSDIQAKRDERLKRAKSVGTDPKGEEGKEQPKK